MIPEPLPPNESLLRLKLTADPADWETRRQLAHHLYDKGDFAGAADAIWQADEIPTNDIDLAFAARMLAKAQPRKAIRLLTAVLENNCGKAVQHLGMANALLHHGMVLEAARFYGAALAVDPTLVNPELEHFMLWTDDEMTLWADFSKRRPKLGELPWMARDPEEAIRLTKGVSQHTTPIRLPAMPAVPGEQLSQTFYQQEAAKNARITPPPAVTIPIDRVDPKHRRFDEHYGAEVSAGGPAPTPVTTESPAAPPDVSLPRPVPAVPLSQQQAVVLPRPVPAVPPDQQSVLSSPASVSPPAERTQGGNPQLQMPTVPLPKAIVAPGAPTRKLLSPGGKAGGGAKP